jgi:hypothetical protein
MHTMHADHSEAVPQDLQASEIREQRRKAHSVYANTRPPSLVAGDTAAQHEAATPCPPGQSCSTTPAQTPNAATCTSAHDLAEQEWRRDVELLVKVAHSLTALVPMRDQHTQTQPAHTSTPKQDVRACALTVSDTHAADIPGAGDLPLLTPADAAAFPLPNTLTYALTQCAVERIRRSQTLPQLLADAMPCRVPYTVYDAAQDRTVDVPCESYAEGSLVTVRTTAQHQEGAREPQVNMPYFTPGFHVYDLLSKDAEGTLNIKPLRVVYLSIVNPCRAHNRMFRAIFDAKGNAQHTRTRVMAEAVVWHTHLIEKRAGYSSDEGCWSAVPLRIVPRDYGISQVQCDHVCVWVCVCVCVCMHVYV